MVRLTSRPETTVTSCRLLAVLSRGMSPVATAAVRYVVPATDIAPPAWVIFPAAIRVKSPDVVMPAGFTMPVLAISDAGPLTVIDPGAKSPLAWVRESAVSVLPIDAPVLVKLLVTVKDPVPPSAPEAKLSVATLMLPLRLTVAPLSLRFAAPVRDEPAFRLCVPPPANSNVLVPLAGI